MACYHPLKGYRARVPEVSGKRRIVFDSKQGFADRPVVVACGQCIGCRLEHSRQWAIRCVHEASLYDDNCFITLTYRDECLPKNLSLEKNAFPLFMKRLRKRTGAKMKYFMCGEYGERLGRPHYHACIFGWRPEDLKLWSIRDGVRLYTSEFLEGCWKYGFSTVGDVTFESAAYVARYILKKMTGEKAEAHYSVVDSTGEIVGVREPEFTTMSRGGRTGHGLAYGWFAQYKNDVFPGDFVVLRGRKLRTPRYYDSLYDQVGDLDAIKRKRVRETSKHKENNTPERLATREKVKNAQLGLLKRRLQ